uniref:Uncharacterized protein n=1 Tax=Octopus bimaculoides TaxID=37653 RepID=A0A0L8HSW1_OCTBM
MIKCRAIELRLMELWRKAVHGSLGKGNLAMKNAFIHSLDTPFNILNCKCSIVLCSKEDCSTTGKRGNPSRIDCCCPCEMRIPFLELDFITSQRTIAGG